MALSKANHPQTSISPRTTLNHLRVNIKHFLGPILGAEVAQKRAPFPAVVTRTEMGNANICILCDVVKKVERREGVLLDILMF